LWVEFKGFGLTFAELVRVGLGVCRSGLSIAKEVEEGFGPGVGRSGFGERLDFSLREKGGRPGRDAGVVR